MNVASYDVLSPWSETDPIPLQGISPRLSDIRGKRIGLFANNKPAAGPIQDAVEAELRTRYGGDVAITRFSRPDHGDAGNSADDGQRYTKWLQEEVDAVIVAVGD
jgi:hypothetical protein